MKSKFGDNAVVNRVVRVLYYWGEVSLVVKRLVFLTWIAINHYIAFVLFSNQPLLVLRRSGQASGLIHGVLQGRHCSYTFTEKEIEERTQSVIRQVLLITALECTNEITPENLATMKRIAPLMKLMPCCRNYWGCVGGHLICWNARHHDDVRLFSRQRAQYDFRAA